MKNYKPCLIGIRKMDYIFYTIKIQKKRGHLVLFSFEFTIFVKNLNMTKNHYVVTNPEEGCDCVAGYQKKP